MKYRYILTDLTILSLKEKEVIVGVWKDPNDPTNTRTERQNIGWVALLSNQTVFNLGFEQPPCEVGGKVSLILEIDDAQP